MHDTRVAWRGRTRRTSSSSATVSTTDRRDPTLQGPPAPEIAGGLQTGRDLLVLFRAHLTKPNAIFLRRPRGERLAVDPRRCPDFCGTTFTQLTTYSTDNEERLAAAICSAASRGTHRRARSGEAGMQRRLEWGGFGGRGPSGHPSRTRLAGVSVVIAMTGGSCRLRRTHPSMTVGTSALDACAATSTGCPVLARPTFTDIE